MACAFGTELLASYDRAVSAARLSGSSPRNQAQADVALMALLTHEAECRACGDPNSTARTIHDLTRVFALGLPG